MLCCIGGLLSIKFVVGRFPRNVYVVHVAFPQSSGGYLHEFGPLMQVGNRVGPTVAHSGTNAAEQLVDRIRQSSAIGNTAFDALGNQFTRIIDIALEIAVAAAF